MVVLIAGGSGGHVFPAVAVAQKYKEKGENNLVLITDQRGVFFVQKDTDLFEEIIVLFSMAPAWQKRWLLPFRFVIETAVRTTQLWHLFHRKKVKIVLGFGGQITIYPLLWGRYIAGMFKRRPVCAVHQSDRFLGRANCSLARHMDYTFLSWPDTLNVPKKARVEVVGTPLRSFFFQPSASDEQKPSGFQVLVLGGSQGARFWSKLLPEALSSMSLDNRRRLSIIHHARSEDEADLRQKYDDLGVDAEVLTFIENMRRAIGKSHVALTRAGASTVAELIEMQCPAFFVPYPYATDDHQFWNVESLTRAGASWMSRQEDLTPQILKAFLMSCLEDPSKILKASQALKAFQYAPAASKIIQFLDCNTQLYRGAQKRCIGD